MKMYITDARELGICISGIKKMAEDHGIDFKDYVRNGVDISKVEHIDDDNMRRTIEVAKKNRQEEADGQQ